MVHTAMEHLTRTHAVESQKTLSCSKKKTLLSFIFRYGNLCQSSPKINTNRWRRTKISFFHREISAHLSITKTNVTRVDIASGRFVSRLSLLVIISVIEECPEKIENVIPEHKVLVKVTGQVIR